MNAIRCHALVKKFGEKSILSNLNFEVSIGSAVGLLGKNGAGKTTLNRILTGLSFATSGDVAIFGEPPKCGNKQISFLSENISIYPNLSAAENLRQVFLLNQMTPNKKKIESILGTVSIDNNSKKAEKFSLGMKRRLQIAMSVLVIDRDIIILDEPTNGLDINGVIWLKQLLESFKVAGKTLVIASHAIRELEDILTNYAIISNGNVVACGEMEKILDSDTIIKLHNSDIEFATKLLKDNKIEFRINNNIITLLDSNEELLSLCLKVFIEHKITPMNYSSQKKSLVDLFISHTGGHEYA